MQVQTGVYVCGCVWICVVVCRCLFILLYLFFVPAALVCWRRLLVGAAALVSLPACSRIGSLTGLLVLSSIPHIADPPIPCTRDPPLCRPRSHQGLSLSLSSAYSACSAPPAVSCSALLPLSGKRKQAARALLSLQTHPCTTKKQRAPIDSKISNPVFFCCLRTHGLACCCHRRMLATLYHALLASLAFQVAPPP